LPLTDFEILNGIFSIIFVTISIFVGLKIISKYFEYKHIEFLLVGITWVGIVSPWYPSCISFIIALFNDGVGLQNTPEIYFIIGNVLIPFFLISWLIAFTNLLYKNQQKIIVTIALIYCVMFEIGFFYLLITGQSESIGVMQGAVDVKYERMVRVFLLSIVAIILITGSLFARVSLKSNNPEVRLKGWFLLTAFILFSIGAVFDAAFDLNYITLPIVRIILILSALCFYCGFILPAPVRKFFMKEEKKKFKIKTLYFSKINKS